MAGDGECVATQVKNIICGVMSTTAVIARSRWSELRGGIQWGSARAGGVDCQACSFPQLGHLSAL